jgi:hypothetical protein
MRIIYFVHSLEVRKISILEIRKQTRKEEIWRKFREVLKDFFKGWKLFYFKILQILGSLIFYKNKFKILVKVFTP